MNAFAEITLIDFTQPLAKRAQSRKVASSYRWRPATPGIGRGFYQSSTGLACDRHGSSFRLRLEWANEYAPRSLARIDGYFVDDHCDETLQPIIARLPHGRGFLAGWTMGAGMCATLEACVYADVEDAARAAHHRAEYDAEIEREYARATTCADCGGRCDGEAACPEAISTDAADGTPVVPESGTHKTLNALAAQWEGGK